MNSESPENSRSNKLLDTLVRILAPVARLMIAKGVTFQMASEVLKRAYVRAANEHFVEEDGASGTKLSLLTGLNRKEIRRLTSDEPENERPPMRATQKSCRGEPPAKNVPSMIWCAQSRPITDLRQCWMK